MKVTANLMPAALTPSGTGAETVRLRRATRPYSERWQLTLVDENHDQIVLTVDEATLGMLVDLACGTLGVMGVMYPR